MISESRSAVIPTELSVFVGISGTVPMQGFLGFEKLCLKFLQPFLEEAACVAGNVSTTRRLLVDVVGGQIVRYLGRFVGIGDVYPTLMMNDRPC